MRGNTCHLTMRSSSWAQGNKWIKVFPSGLIPCIFRHCELLHELVYLQVLRYGCRHDWYCNKTLFTSCGLHGNVGADFVGVAGCEKFFFVT